MKKVLFVLCTAIYSFSMAQSNVLDSVKQYGYGINGWSEVLKETYQYALPANRIRYNKIYYGNIHEYYTYQYDSLNRLNLVLGYIKNSNGDFVQGGKQEYTYNLEGHVVLWLDYLYSTNTPNGILDKRIQYFYSPQGQLQSVEKSDYIIDTWRNSYQINYTYDMQNRLLEELYLPWENNPPQWDDNGLLTLYTYSSGNMPDTIMQGGSSLPLEPFKREIYTYYNGTDSVETRIIQRLDTAWQLVNDEKELRLYNADMTVDSICYMKWDTLTSDWKPYKAKKFYYSFFTGITEDIFYFNFYPNPANTVFKIDLQAQDIWLQIVDVMGGLVKEGHYLPAAGVDISALPTGMYYVKIKTPKGIAVKPLIKQ